jgi:4-hydroxy-3-methylbut-2-enyl diphosphate reductase
MNRQVLIARDSGFCEGVKRAVELAQKAINSCKTGSRIYSLGKLVHNSFVVQKFRDLGVTVVNNLEEIVAPGYLIISAHGVAPKIYQQAAKAGLKVIDTTCPWVKKVQDLGRDYAEEKYQVLIVGDREHPEVKGVVEWSGGLARVLETPDDVEKLPDFIRAVVVAQTTQSVENFEKIVAALKEKIPKIIVYNTICGATGKRQQSAVELARKVPVMLVIGDFSSANTRRLYELCRSVNKKTYYLQSVQDLTADILEEFHQIGITAGASTPEWIIKEIINKISNP